MTDRRVAVCVLGMHRSGTSIITKCLEGLGIDLGDRFIAALPNNPTGFWEHPDVVAVNDAVLAARGGTWDSVVLDEIDSIPRGAYGELVASGATVVAGAWGGRALFGIKDPRAARNVPFWREVLVREHAEPRFVIVVRHPSSVAESLAARDGFSPGKSVVLWLEHTVAALMDTERDKRVVVNYDSFMDDPGRQLDRIREGLGIGGRASESEVFREWVRGDLRHSQHDEPTSVGIMAAEVGSVWRACRALAADAHCDLGEVRMAMEPLMRDKELWRLVDHEGARASQYREERNRAIQAAAAAEARGVEAEVRCQAAERSRMATHADNDALRIRMRELELERIDAASRLATMQDDLVTSMGELRARDKTISEMRAESAELRRRANDSEHEAVEVRRRWRAAEASRDMLAAERVELENRWLLASSESQVLRSERDALRARLASAEDRVARATGLADMMRRTWRWRLTAPLGYARAVQLRWTRGGGRGGGG